MLYFKDIRKQVKPMRSPTLEMDMKTITDENLPWEKFKNKSIIISGANGLLPAYMIETFLYLNEKRGLRTKIIGLARNEERAKIRFRSYSRRNDFQLMIQDISQPFSLSEKVDFIIHAASQASPKYYGIDPVGTLSANILGTHQLLEIAKQQNIENFLYFSSGEIYGEVSEKNIPTKEHDYGYIDPIQVRSCYAESKRMGENMCIAYAHQFGLSVMIVRPFHIYGPGIKLDDGRVFSDFVANIVNEKDIIIRSKGSAIRAFCYIADATIGFFTVLLNGKNSEAYNIGNPACSISILELANRLTALFPEKKLKIIQENRLPQLDYIESKISFSCPDITKAVNLGWQPKTSIEEGFSKTVESFNESVRLQ